MGAESEPKSGIEYRRRIPFRKWTPLGEGLFVHTEEVTHAMAAGLSRVITSVQYDEEGKVVVGDMIYNGYLKKYEIRQTTFSQNDIEGLNNFARMGLVPRQFRRRSS
jgi:hypothetical protein